MTEPGSEVDRGGRPATTNARALAEAAQRLFLARGFEATTVEDITAAAGVSRRTFFRYFPTKADVLWVESPAELERLRAALAVAGPGEDYAEVVVRAVLTALDHPAEQQEWARQRAVLVHAVPAVQAHAALVFAAWREAAAGFAARQCGVAVDSLFAVTVGHAVLAGTLAAHQHWTAHPGTALPDALRAALGLLLPAAP